MSTLAPPLGRALIHWLVWSPRWLASGRAFFTRLIAYTLSVIPSHTGQQIPLVLLRGPLIHQASLWLSLARYWALVPHWLRLRVLGGVLSFGQDWACFDTQLLAKDGFVYLEYYEIYFLPMFQIVCFLNFFWHTANLDWKPYYYWENPVYTLQLSQKSDFQSSTMKPDNIGHLTVKTGQIWHLGGFPFCEN